MMSPILNIARVSFSLFFGLLFTANDEDDIMQLLSFICLNKNSVTSELLFVRR
jgi:hypothetical protein